MKKLYRPMEIEVVSNLTLTSFERGKRKPGGSRRHTHNIFLTLGREWLPDAISYSSLPAGSPPPGLPVTKADDRGVRFIGFGIGGAPTGGNSGASAAPYVTHYPGTNANTDDNPAVQRLERPVRVTGGTSLPPYGAGDIWLGQVQAPAVRPTTTSVRFTRIFLETDISYGPYTSVPLSEILLVLHSTSDNFTHVHNNTGIAYDVFPVLHKTSAIVLQADWELRF